MRRAARAIWCRGYLFGIVLALVWLITIFWWPGVQFPGGFQPLRAVLQHGVILVNWNHQNSRLPRFGHVEWSLGVMCDSRGNVKPGFWASIAPRSPFPWPQFDIELRPGHIKVPVIYAALIAGLPAITASYLRSRRLPPGACRGCGYDLRGTSGKTCPECGLGEPLLRK